MTREQESCPLEGIPGVAQYHFVVDDIIIAAVVGICRICVFKACAVTPRLLLIHGEVLLVTTRLDEFPTAHL